MTLGDGGRDRRTAGVTTEQDRSSVTKSDDAPATSLEARIIAAIDEAEGGSIVAVAQDEAQGPDTMSWSDEVTGARRDLQLDEAGNPRYDAGLVAAPAPEDPSPREPADEPDPSELFDPNAAPNLDGRVVDHCLGLYVESPAPVYPGSEAASIRDGLADGTKVLDGAEVIDGREMIRVRTVISPNTHGGTSTVPPGPGPHAPEVPYTDDSRVTYVDPETYRPVMVRAYVGSEAEYTMRITFLDRTPENLAVLVAPVPAGFSLVDSFPDGDSRDALACR